MANMVKSCKVNKNCNGILETKIKMIKESNFSTTATVTPTTTTTVNDLIHESVTTPEEQTVPSMQDIVSFMSKHKLA